MGRFCSCILVILSFTFAGASAVSANPQDRTSKPLNVNGNQLATCSKQPLTGWFRDGYCRTNDRDQGRHVVCAVMTEEFLALTKSKGNDLSTPKPQFRFPGLKPGDRWCLCALRWREALKFGEAPPVELSATHQKALQYVTKSQLEAKRIQGKNIQVRQ